MDTLAASAVVQRQNCYAAHLTISDLQGGVNGWTIEDGRLPIDSCCLKASAVNACCACALSCRTDNGAGGSAPIDNRQSTVVNQTPNEPRFESA